jgi:hypothetical protein
MKHTTTIMETTGNNGVTVSLKKIGGLSVPYYAIDVLNKEMFASRQLRTMTTKNENAAYKLIASLVAQLSNDVGFWNLKFTTI